MTDRGPAPTEAAFRVLAVTQGLWGERIAENVRAHAPADWRVETWAAPPRIPPIVDEPEEYLPDPLPRADLLLALGEAPGLAQLIPDLVRRTGAQAVLAPIDRNESLPAGLAAQLRGWLDELGVPVAFPRPFCSLSESGAGRTPRLEAIDHPHLKRFARAFGRPELRLTVEAGRVTAAEVVRDAACGCARHVAAGLPGTPVDQAVEAAGMLHHHFPCLASMNIDVDYNDTLMHVSGHLLQDAIKEALGEHAPRAIYLRPDNFVQE